MKSYYGSKPSMFFFGSDGKIARPDYTPDETFETDMSYVKYSMPGADANGMVVQVGQMVGLGAMSKQTAMEMLPQIEDPVRERDQVELEGLRQALLAGLEQQASAGTLDPNIIARIAKKKAERHVTLEDAVSKIHEEMQEEQAAKANAQAQPQPEASPEMQPGLGQSPENPIQGPTPAGPQGKPSIQDLLASLHTQSEASQVPNPMPAGTPIPQGA
jgi:cell pole-organizing protein PopZ